MSVFNRLIGAVNRAVRCAPHGGSRDLAHFKGSLRRKSEVTRLKSMNLSKELSSPWVGRRPMANSNGSREKLDVFSDKKPPRHSPAEAEPEYDLARQILSRNQVRSRNALV